MHAQNRLATGSISYNGSKDTGLRPGRLRGLHSTQLPLRRGRLCSGVLATKSYVRFPPKAAIGRKLVIRRTDYISG
jgi:hypothetical protein